MLTGLGTTETAPFALVRHRARRRAGNIGLPAPGVELKLVPAATSWRRASAARTSRPATGAQPELTRRGLRRGRLLPHRRRRSSSSTRAIRAEGFLFDGRIAEDFKLVDRHLGQRRPAARAASSPPAPSRAGRRRSPASTATTSACWSFPTRRLPRLRRPAAERAADSAARRRAGCAEFPQLLDDAGGAQHRQRRRASRARIVLAEPPSIDRGEVTDKGSINQRAVLTHRAALADELCTPTPLPFPHQAADRRSQETSQP